MGIRMVLCVAFDRPFVPQESSFLEDLSLAKDDRTDKPDREREERTGLLIIRAWVEEGSSEPLRVQIRLTTDVSEGFQRTINLTDVEETSAAVQGWLTDIAAETASPE